MSLLRPRISVSAPAAGPVLWIVLMIGVWLWAQPVEASGQSLNKTLQVASDSPNVEVINQTGSIRINSASAGGGKVSILSRQPDSVGRVNVTQGSDGRIKVEVTGKAPIDFEISVPSAARLDLLIYKGSIQIANNTGEVRARVTTDGSIALTGLRSRRIEAYCGSGNITFNGDLISGGEYILKTFSGRIDATFPSAADFGLSASAYSGVIDLGGFPMKFNRQTNQQVEASVGSGAASVRLWTQEGSIYLHRRP